MTLEIRDMQEKLETELSHSKMIVSSFTIHPPATSEELTVSKWHKRNVRTLQNAIKALEVFLMHQKKR